MTNKGPCGCGPLAKSDKTGPLCPHGNFIFTSEELTRKDLDEMTEKYANQFQGCGHIFNVEKYVLCPICTEQSRQDNNGK